MARLVARSIGGMEMEPGKPLLATLLVYLDVEWSREWDAETLFLDPPTGTGVFVRPRGGRAVMMDQDITHRISTPSQAAGRPRYSLVWKLALFPRAHGREAPLVSAGGEASPELAETDLVSGDPDVFGHPAVPLTISRPRWGNPVRFGSADGGGDGDGDGDAARTLLSERARLDSQTKPESIRETSATALPSISDGIDWAASNVDGSSCALPEWLAVEVRSAGAKGKGVFATRAIDQGEIVGFYKGEVLSAKELDDRYPNFGGSEYVMQIGRETYLDAVDPELSGVARYINHSEKSPNLVVDSWPGAPDAVGEVSDKVALVATRDIAEGEELTFDYGEGYFEDDEVAGDAIEDGLEMQDLLRGVDWGSQAFTTQQD